MKMKCFLTAAALLFCTNAYADGWNYSLHITSVEISSWGANAGTRTALTFQEQLTAAPSCASSSQAMLAGTAENIKSMTDLANAAMINGRIVDVWFDGTCTAIYPNIMGLTMR